MLDGIFSCPEFLLTTLLNQYVSVQWSEGFLDAESEWERSVKEKKKTPKSGIIYQSTLSLCDAFEAIRSRFVSSRKLTQSHLVMNNIFPPINGHSRPPSEDLHGLTTTGSVDMHSTSKPTQLRRQPHIIEPHRRTPLRSTSMLPTPATRYVTAAAAAAAAVASPSISGSPLLRSPSFVQTGASTQFEPAKSKLNFFFRWRAQRVKLTYLKREKPISKHLSIMGRRRRKAFLYLAFLYLAFLF